MTTALWLLGESDASTLGVMVAALLGGGLLAGFAAYKRAGPESEAIAARTLIQVNEELRKELSRRALEHAQELKFRDEQIAALRERVAVLESRSS
jgi:flagellar motility protein MotE (MotC chaperone)